MDQLREKVAAVPGVDGVGAVNLPPFGMNNMARFSIQGRVPRAPGQFDSATRFATPGYFHALGIPLLQGRSITEEDRPDAPSAMVIDDVMAKRFWPGESPIGAVVHIGGPPRTVVGVVGAVRHSGLDADLSPTFYLPQKQEPMVSRQMTLMVRAREPARASSRSSGGGEGNRSQPARGPASVDGECHLDVGGQTRGSRHGVWAASPSWALSW